MGQAKGLFGRLAVHAFVEPEGVVAVPGAGGFPGPLAEVVVDGKAPGGVRTRYVGARLLRWHEPLFARIVVSRRWCSPGEIIPPWYYALGYVDPMKGASGEAVFFFLPIALLVRALRWWEFLWNRLRCRPSWFDRQLQAAAERVEERRAFVTHVSAGCGYGPEGVYACFSLRLADGRVFCSEDGDTWSPGTEVEGEPGEPGWVAVAQIARRARA